MLKSHMDAREAALVAISKVPANAGHPLHKGTPREAFIKEFLENHLPSNVSIGTGEIIDSNAEINQHRNQFDIVIYKRNYPKLDFGGGISGFLIESVIATIEVKSLLTSQELKKAVKAAHNAKQLCPNIITSFHTGYIPPKVLNYVVAYDGPASMQNVYTWINPIYRKLGIVQGDIPIDDDKRIQTPSESIDGVFILKKGFLCFDNIPYGFSQLEQGQKNPMSKWIYVDTPEGNLLFFFILLQGATANIEGRWLNPIPYLSKFNLPDIKWGT